MITVDSADGEVLGRAVDLGVALGAFGEFWLVFVDTFGVAFGGDFLTGFFTGFFVVAFAEEPSQSEVIDPSNTAMNFLLLEFSSEGSRFTR